MSLFVIFVYNLVTMKHCLHLLLSVVMATAGYDHAAAQQKMAPTVVSLKQRNPDWVVYTISSHQGFIMGDNKYVLHIGNRSFDRYDQVEEEDTSGKLIFQLPTDAFNMLTNGDAVYLTYGDPGDQNQLPELAKDATFPCWSLGTLNKKSLIR
jgi:hypothetical protein